MSIYTYTFLSSFKKYKVNLLALTLIVSSVEVTTYNKDDSCQGTLQIVHGWQSPKQVRQDNWFKSYW